MQNISTQLEAMSFPIQVTQGMRTWAQQDALYAQIPKVTNARGGYSNHNFGLAADVAPFIGTIPDWNTSHPGWKAIVALAPSCGLRDGISWRDEPHLELIEVSPVPTDEMRQTFLAAGVEAVWDELNIPVFGG